MFPVFSCMLLWLAFAARAYAQSSAEAPAYAEPGAYTGVIVFLVLVSASVAVFAFWIWYRSRKQR